MYTSTSRMNPSPSSPLEYQQTDTSWSQETIPFDSFDAVWYYDWKEEKYYRLMITKGKDQIVLSVQGAKKIATIERFDKLIGNIVPDESSPDLSGTAQARRHQDQSHQSFSQIIPWTSGLE